MDKWDEIFKLQEELNLRIGVDSAKISQDEEQTKEWLLNYSRAMGQELSELIDSVPWKWWAKYQKMDIQNARVEMVDLLHFLVSIAQVLGMSADDVFELYTKKHRLNNQRQETGYSVKNENDNQEL